jgi:bacterioferritin-associated ferredoxin
LIICHCHRVTASDAHLACAGRPDADWRTVVKETRAATGCGGCLRSLRKTVEDALAARITVPSTPAVTSADSVAHNVVHAG